MPSHTRNDTVDRALAAAFFILATVFVVYAATGRVWATDETVAVRFESLDVFIDSGNQPLAAYQFELLADDDSVQIVGVEGGEPAAFREPPFYDPVALNNNRIILAAFSTNNALPHGKVRVARVHVQVQRDTTPKYATELTVAASADGSAIPSTLSIVVAKGDSQ